MPFTYRCCLCIISCTLWFNLGCCYQ